MIVFISTSSFAKFDPTPMELLNKAGMRVMLNPFDRKLTKIELIKLAAKATGLIAGTETLDSKILNQLQNLKVISRCGVSMDNVDLMAAERLGIKVFNTPNTPTVAAAELTIGLILTLLRKISLMDREMRANLWKKRMGNLLMDKKVGIVGFGRIGRKVAEFLKALGANIIYSDPHIKETSVFSKVELKELLEKADIITLHLPYTKENHYLFSKREFSLMKQGTFLINCSRGGIVDENALYLALKEDKLSGAALDVFEQEPYDGPLKELDNVILTPHIGSYAKEARVKMEIQAVENLITGLGNL